VTERMTAADYAQQQSSDKGADKGADKGRVRGTKRTVVEGIKFASKREAKRFGELRQLQRAGIIRDLKLQVPFPLHGKDGPILTPTGRQMRYKADFQYFDVRLNCMVTEDAKGWATDVSKMKLAIMAAQGVEVVLV